ncbi:MAG: hypothetical protein OZSIB_2277 [Candidatus Ozemobacter sibiricus]|jgi:hypothetical protein|uniref:Uncharacterized protein n=1 Tax=Candidatus Ozemobacter sibiricus TaxID=2268124 RepID=A0A367ZTE5_9BACT|nr:MAG: hypothetical protein OZSIB_2277 [Candidatus Ozemobacter sibiricus]
MVRTFATVLLILASLAGFLFSYEFAYHKIARVLDRPADQPNAAWIARK